MARRKQKALIVGSNGFVGGHLSRELLSAGYEVCGADRGASVSGPGFSSYSILDIVDSLAVDDLVRRERPDYLVNLAALSSVGASWESPQLAMMINVVGPTNILEACRRHAPECKVLLIGSSEEYEFSNEPLTETSPIAGDQNRSRADSPSLCCKLWLQCARHSIFQSYGAWPVHGFRPAQFLPASGFYTKQRAGWCDRGWQPGRRARFLRCAGRRASVPDASRTRAQGRGLQCRQWRRVLAAKLARYHYRLQHARRFRSCGSDAIPSYRRSEDRGELR